MTLAEIRTAVWEELGEPPNCDPAVASGLARLNGWINRGYKKILFWKFPDGTQVRFPATEGETYFQTALVSGTIAASTTSTITLDGSAGSNDDQYIGWLIETTLGLHLVVAYDGSSKTATIAETLDSAPTGTYSLYKRHMKFLAAGEPGASENIILSSRTEIKEVQKIVLIEEQREIMPALRIETFAGAIFSPGRPSEYIRRGSQIIFDCPVDEALWFHLEYAKIPPDLTTDDDEPEMPETFHEAIMFWALWRGYRWNQETDMAYSTKKDLMDFMATTKAPVELSADREEARVELNLG